VSSHDLVDPFDEILPEELLEALIDHELTPDQFREEAAGDEYNFVPAAPHGARRAPPDGLQIQYVLLTREMIRLVAILREVAPRREQLPEKLADQLENVVKEYSMFHNTFTAFHRERRDDMIYNRFSVS